MTDTASEQLTPQQKAAATRAAKKAESEQAAAQAAYDALSDDDKAALAALSADELASLAALVAAPAEAPAPSDDADPNVGVFVGYGATCHGTEGGMYAVDPDTGLTTGPFVPDDDTEQ